LDAAAQELAIARDVPRRVVRAPEAVAARRQQREMQTMLSASEPASKAILNVAKAKEAMAGAAA
jgi:hypothetical protein